MIEAIVTDLDGVIRFFPPERDQSVEMKYGLPTHAISSQAFAPELLRPALLGLLPDESWRERVVVALKKEYPLIDCAAAMEEWSNYPGVVNVDTMWFLRTLCADIPLVLLSNATSRLEEDLRKLDILRLFDRVYSSSLLGKCKPDPAVFTLLSQRTKLNPAKILFIDDQQENVDAAVAAGFLALRFTDLASLRQALLDYFPGAQDIRG